MILKTLGIKDANAADRIIKYILRESEVLRDEKDKPFLIRHNVFGNIQDVEAQFIENSKRRLHPRSDMNHFLHTIISLSDGDREKVTPEILNDLCEKYISLLDPDSLYFGSLHMDKNPHAHLLVSGNNMMGMATRMTKQEFEQLKQALEQYQEQTYSELTHSIVEHGGHERGMTDREWQIGHAGRVSRKEELRQIVASSFQLATTKEEFFTLLRQEENLTIYTRGGKEAGIEDANRSFRFATLGVDLDELSERENRMNELQGLGQGMEIEEEKTEENEWSVEQQRLDELRNLDRMTGSVM